MGPYRYGSLDPAGLAYLGLQDVNTVNWCAAFGERGAGEEPLVRHVRERIPHEGGAGGARG